MKRLYFYITFICLLFATAVKAQNFIKVGIGSDFKKGSFIQTFSFDLNRTDKVEASPGPYFLFNNHGVYILPTIDLNVGPGVSSSENNVLGQAKFGKKFFGTPHQSADNLTTFVTNKAIELNPSYTADKSFNEKLYYGQIKGIFSKNSQHFATAIPGAVIDNIQSFTIGAFSNIGYRKSNIYVTGASYITVGFLVDKTILFRARPTVGPDFDRWILKLSGSYYRIIHEVKNITNDKWGGQIKVSADRRISGPCYLGLTYKYGNDTPLYAYFHTLDLSFKVKY